MKVTTGIDIINVTRIKDIIDENPLFVNKVFTVDEIRYCENAKAHKYECFAVRFAAKEAIFKSLNVNDMDNTIEWKDIEIINEKTGRPKVKLSGKYIKYIENICNLDISLSHEKDMAVANAVILWK